MIHGNVYNVIDDMQLDISNSNYVFSKRKIAIIWVFQNVCMEDNFVIIHKNHFFKVNMDSNINIQIDYFTDKLGPKPRNKQKLF